MLPAFKIPLTKDELALIGEIAAIQGQIDYLINALTAKILKLPPATIENIYGKATIYPKIQQLQRFAQNLSEPADFQAKLADVIAALQPAVTDRNNFAHGIFGYQYDEIGNGHVLCGQSPDGAKTCMFYISVNGGMKKEEPLVPTAFKSQAMGKRNDLSKLPDLRDCLASISQSLGYLYEVIPFPNQNGPGRVTDTWQYTLGE